MNDINENYLSMFIAIKNILFTNKTKWDMNPAFLTSYNDFVAKITRIQELQEELKVNIKGITENKTELRGVFTAALRKVQAALYSYSISAGYEILEADVNYNKTDLKQMRDTDLVAVGTKILNLGTSNIINLGDFGVVQADLDALDTTKGLFEAALGKPREAITERSAKVKAISEEVKFTEQILTRQIDNYMSMFEVSDMEFYDGYFKAREIVDLGKRLISIKGKVLDYVRRAPIRGALIEMGGKSVKTGRRGAYRFMSLSPMTYNLKASQNEFETQEYSNIVIEEGKMTKKDILMIRKDEGNIIRARVLLKAWEGMPYENLRVTVHNRSFDMAELWVYWTHSENDPLPEEKTIILPGGNFKYIPFDLGYRDTVCMRLYNPDYSKIVVFQVELTGVLNE